MLLFLSIAVVLLASTQAYTQRDANGYIEEVLNARFIEEAQYSRLDPYKLPRIDEKLYFNTRPSGQITLSKGTINNLSKVRRAGDCTEPNWQSANISFTCFLRFDHLQMNYTTYVSLDNVGITFYPHVVIKGVNVTVQVTSAQEENVPNLKMFFINHVGGMDVTAKMITIGDYAQVIGPPAREVLLRHSTIFLHEALRSRFKDALAFSIYKTRIGFLDD